MRAKLKNGIKILVGPTVFELLIKTCKLLFWLIIKNHLAYYILMPFLNFSDNLLQDAYYFSKSIDNFEMAHKNMHAKFWLRVLFPWRGYCTSYPKIIMFTISNLSTSFWKIIHASYSINCPKNTKNSIKIYLGQAVLELLIQTSFWLFSDSQFKNRLAH